MPLKRPYYGLHQIIAGQYTAGGEYVLDDGLDYIGAYHILPNNQKFTHSQPKTASREMFEKRNDVTEDVLFYNRLTERKESKYVSPVPYQPIPNLDDYAFGEIERYFVQKRNNLRATITEIDVQQYNQINVDNSPGINGIVWNRLLIPWKISNIPVHDVAELNRRQVIHAEENFMGIGSYILNVLEFYK